MEFKAGMRVRSTLSKAEFVVVRGPKEAAAIELGGVSLVDATSYPGDATDGAPGEGELLVGKRYADDETGAELLCTKGVVGSLTIDGRPLGVKQAKALPSSD
jgi:hypothetical protein